MDNCKSVAENLLAELRIKFTKKFIEDSILSHPDHPSLLSISDTLSKYNIENLAVKTEKSKLQSLPLPCIVQLSGQNNKFYVLVEFSDQQAIYIDDNRKKQKISVSKLLNKWTGICLLVEKTEYSGEPNIKNKLTKKKWLNSLKWSVILFFLFWFTLNFDFSHLINQSNSIWIVAYLITKVIGLSIGILLLWHEIDGNNPKVQSFCSRGGNKIDCDYVLNSKYARLFNGSLSLSLIAFSYYFGTLLYALSYEVSSSSLAVLSYLNFLTIPVIFISVYFQGVIIKKWCSLCITIQGVLLIELIIGLIGDFNTGKIEYNTIPLIISLFLFPVLIWNILFPILFQNKEVFLHKRNLSKIKYNKDVFHGLLSKSRKIKSINKELGILFLNQNTKYHVVKVCNPYCGPCSNAHPILEELINNGKISLQVIFNATTNENDIKTKPVSHFLDIASTGNEELTQKSLNTWYSSKDITYEDFAEKFPMKGSMEEQHDKIMAMEKWCNDENITHTPTIFINGYELPREYNIEDLRDVLV
ncbi:VKOR family protein [Robertkochia marina]|uniref:VKOR family protein n=1 Tax=Robertkochia marina TaxID=1227945 RepID=A0A4S3LZR1_9FLAO|nr:vitamin K epoxide reductase family protein [Robertkochia marina]THD67612.1 VKOR family protein [Robertkochia marina]TRZ40777.1 VKOR family protein [Robertkochia marina]